VKVLDFGLAKAMEPVGAAPNNVSQLPTITTPAMTQAGVVLGTSAYMSPEQARGKPVDKRTDIWAFGCVLFEMLTGRAAFDASTASDSIARILNGEPDWPSLPSSTPPRMVRLLRRCLQRDPRQRLRDLGDFDLALEHEPGTHEQRHARRGTIIAGVVAGTALGAAATLLLGGGGGRSAVPVSPVTFEVPLPFTSSDVNTFSVSPDGRQLVFTGNGPDGARRLWLRSLDALETRPISGSEGQVALNTPAPFWSPDSRQIAFYADGAVKKMDVVGGDPSVVCEVSGIAVGGAWSALGTIVVGNASGGLFRCPAAGGRAEPVTVSGASDRSVAHLFPTFLPDGRRLLYLRVSRANPSENGLHVADLERAPGDQPPDRVMGTGFGADYVPAPDGSGRILFARDRVLWSVAVDPRSLRLAGDPVAVGSPVGSFLDGALFSAARDTVVYRSDNRDVQLTWRDRKGARLGTVGEPAALSGVALSRDATRAVVRRENRLNRMEEDLWMVDLARQTLVRFTSDPLPESMPAWTADGRALIFGTGNEDTDIWLRPADGTAGERLFGRDLGPATRVNPLLTTMSASADGRFLIFSTNGTTRTRGDLWILPLAPRGRPRPLLEQEFDQSHGTLSPDGRWLAYVSNESGLHEVSVRPVSVDSSGQLALGAAMAISRGGGSSPRWRGDSGELFFLSPSGGVMSVAVSREGMNAPVELFRAPGTLQHWGVTADGQRFLLAEPASASAPPPLVVTLNWQAPR
jgi:Tol biopolymer transport system component